MHASNWCTGIRSIVVAMPMQPEMVNSIQLIYLFFLFLFPFSCPMFAAGPVSQQDTSTPHNLPVCPYRGNSPLYTYYILFYSSALPSLPRSRVQLFLLLRIVSLVMRRVCVALSPSHSQTVLTTECYI